MLDGKKGLIVGVANDKSLAYGCAKMCKSLGADIIMTYQGEKSLKYVSPLAKEFKSELYHLDVTDEKQIDDLFKKIGQIDFLVHSIAFCPDLKSSILDLSRETLDLSMEISFRSLISLSRYSKSAMGANGAIVTMTYIGSERAVNNYNIMGPIKAALESLVKYLAVELGKDFIRVNALSIGPMQTRAASGIPSFNNLFEESIARSPLKTKMTTEDVGNACAFLVSDMSRCITGETIFVDNGFHAV